VVGWTAGVDTAAFFFASLSIANAIALFPAEYLTLVYGRPSAVGFRVGIRPLVAGCSVTLCFVLLALGVMGRSEIEVWCFALASVVNVVAAERAARAIALGLLSVPRMLICVQSLGLTLLCFFSSMPVVRDFLSIAYLVSSIGMCVFAIGVVSYAGSSSAVVVGPLTARRVSGPGLFVLSGLPTFGFLVFSAGYFEFASDTFADLLVGRGAFYLLGAYSVLLPSAYAWAERSARFRTFWCLASAALALAGVFVTGSIVVGVTQAAAGVAFGALCLCAVGAAILRLWQCVPEAGLSISQSVFYVAFPHILLSVAVLTAQVQLMGMAMVVGLALQILALRQLWVSPVSAGVV
jgi:hypothetical protein